MLVAASTMPRPIPYTANPTKNGTVLGESAMPSPATAITVSPARRAVLLLVRVATYSASTLPPPAITEAITTTRAMVVSSKPYLSLNWGSWVSSTARKKPCRPNPTEADARAVRWVGVGDVESRSGVGSVMCEGCFRRGPFGRCVDELKHRAGRLSNNWAHSADDCFRYESVFPT